MEDKKAQWEKEKKDRRDFIAALEAQVKKREAEEMAAAKAAVKQQQAKEKATKDAKDCWDCQIKQANEALACAEPRKAHGILSALLDSNDSVTEYIEEKDQQEALQILEVIVARAHLLLQLSSIFELGADESETIDETINSMNNESTNSGDTVQVNRSGEVESSSML